MRDRRAANAARVRTLTAGLAVAGVVGTGALTGLAWAAQSDDADTATTGSTTGTTGATATSGSGGTVADDDSGTTTAWPQLSAGNTSTSSHSRSSGS